MPQVAIHLRLPGRARCLRLRGRGVRRRQRTYEERRVPLFEAKPLKLTY